MPAPALSRRALLLSGAAFSLGLPPAAHAQAPAKLRLRLLETTDLHVNVFPYDYYRDRTDDTVGLAKTATLIAAARAEVPNSLLFDNGDVIQGSPLGDYMAYSHGLKPGQVHPIIAAMNRLDYVCGTLGNHEFNYGLDYLGTALTGQNFPSVCANLLKADGTPLVPPTRLFEREMVDEGGRKHRLRIGVIGFVPPQIMQWDQANLAGKVTTLDIVEAARQHLPRLRAESDVVVALCHSGIAGGAPKPGAENAALYLAEVPGIDAIMTGHQHLVFPGKDFANIAGVDAQRGSLHGVPAVMAGFWGSHLGVIDLVLERRDGAWKVADFASEARPIYTRTPERRIEPTVAATEAVLAAARPEHEATLAYVRQPVGETQAAINSYWALVADDPSVQIVSNAQRWYVEGLARAAGLGELPLLSAAAPFKAGGRGGPDYYTDVKPGPLAIKDVADIYLYPNTLRVVKVTGAQLRGWLERSAGLFNRIDPASAEEQALINPRFPSYNFDVIDGVTYRIDVTQPSRFDADGKLAAPEARRIHDLAWQGKPVGDGQVFLVATNNYRAGGGGNFPGADGSTIVLEAPDLNRDVVVRYIVEQKRIDPEADGNWSLAPWPSTARVSFVTGPGAAAFRPAGLRAEPLGNTPDGFTKYRLSHAG
ncbi:bifunctional 2',3'-cyclic-nucleotide 2'-phosphodiesterase/3'-nucleotidase [Roseomonas sp. M0104]|uniref:Bifunctional 2',3'-cyclic-nucleotide 2'-phosphodiesterase/3'-nucleotidase n=1 Tax=Teichococcus coralli TaxID=2545983 RepID=A0A845BB97_9PROT|nr:bifunctional 2',3'-cyclic-nucleotide 2'-phosphodiesterase/3'-nucleotidase [Pseudoroseomonas coralli]MXP63364.1 bifunctional 2',3'-cyclic-nucleotide 2'-phosphodiesterase/3'-nucleotidase [Pseudoroseomonas coralli]